MKAVMTDTLTAPQRSERMARIGAKNTLPEMKVRRLLHGLGYRYRLHGRELPGRPDLVFSRRRKVIFVHGCFWHRHDETECRLTRFPKSNQAFWAAKFHENIKRDQCVQERLRKLGWDWVIAWECETRDMEGLGEKLVEFLDSRPFSRQGNF